MSEILTDIKFDNNALYTLALSAVEAYRREVLGLLLGREYGGYWRIKLTLPLIRADNLYTQVNFDHYHVERVKEFHDLMTTYSFLGFYHSHTDYRNIEAISTLSEFDKTSFLNDEDAKIEIILAIHQSNRSKDIEELNSGKISGSIGGYFFEIAGYVKDLSTKSKYRRATLHLQK